MKWIFVSTAYHDHAKNVALALYEDSRLFQWLVPLMFSSADLGERSYIRKLLPHRVVRNLPGDYIRKYPFWEIPRLAVHRLKLSPVVLDTVWEKSEFSIDRRASQFLAKKEIGGVIGFEHGCLFSIKKAKEQGKYSAVIFASVHHSMREKWVDIQYRENPRWADPSEKILLERAKIRDARRDEEAESADFIYTNSEVTKKSLVDAGIKSEKIIAIPLGMGACGEVVPSKSQVLRVIYAGSVALHKGFHILQKAFLEVPSDKIVLDVYGQIRADPSMLSRSDKIRFHGPVARRSLFEAYRSADIMVFPSFSDGFGQAAAEALGCGVPIIVSENAGVSSFIKSGHNGFVVKPGDSDGIRDALVKCLDDRQGLDRMRFAAFETAKNWTWDDFRAEWIYRFPIRHDF